MKIFWIINADDEFPHRCFFKLTRAEAQWEVDFRIKEAKEDLELLGFCCDKWEVEEEEVPDHLFGYCSNSPEPHTLALSTSPECSVGSIRKYRNGGKYDITCGSCPYYSKEKSND